MREDSIFYNKELYKMDKAEIQKYLLPIFVKRYNNIWRFSNTDDYQIFDEFDLLKNTIKFGDIDQLEKYVSPALIL